MADAGAGGALRRDPRAARRADEVGALPAGPVHARRSSRRWRTAGQVARLVDEGLPYLEIAQRTRRVDDDGDAGRALAAPRRGRLPAGARPRRRRVDRLTIAVPVKGRLREPSVSLLEDAGLGPEQPGERALAFPCRNAPVDVLLVRAADIPEYVQDGVVDCGITGHDLVRERGARVDELLRARLRLAAGSRRRCPRSRRSQTLDDLAGATVATVYPRLARELLPVDGRARRRHRLGRARAAARARRRDRRPRLVRATRCARTGSARSASLLLVAGGPRRHATRSAPAPLAAMLRAVVEARAPPLPDAERARVARSTEICAIVGSALAERPAARGAGHGRGARARPGRRASGGCCRSSRQPAPRRS